MVLVAAGRAPNIEEIGLKEAGVQLTDEGFVKINERMETYAPKASTRSATSPVHRCSRTRDQREGIVLAELLAGDPHVQLVNYGNIPNATYCHPEVASVGLTEQQCKEKKLDYKVGKFPFSASGRARTSGETEGFVKIIRDAKYGEILGAHIIGSHATEILHELVVARANEFTVEEVDLAIHAHPTLSEAIAEAALDSLGRALEHLAMSDLASSGSSISVQLPYEEALELQREMAKRENQRRDSAGRAAAPGAPAGRNHGPLGESAATSFRARNFWRLEVSSCSRSSAVVT